MSLGSRSVFAERNRSEAFRRSSPRPPRREPTETISCRPRAPSSAGHGVGEGLVVVEGDPELAADVGKPRRADAPCPPGNLHRAAERQRWRLDAVARAAGAKHAPVERGVVGREELRALDERLDPRPELSEVVRLRHVLPRQPVDMGEPEFLRRRPDEVNRRVHDPSAREADGAGAVLPIVGRLEIDRDKIHRLLPTIDRFAQRDCGGALPERPGRASPRRRAKRKLTVPDAGGANPPHLTRARTPIVSRSWRRGEAPFNCEARPALLSRMEGAPRRLGLVGDRQIEDNLIVATQLSMGAHQASNLFVPPPRIAPHRRKCHRSVVNVIVAL